MSRYTLRTWTAPSFEAILFLIHPLYSLRDLSSQLSDPGIGWHLQTGRYILETGIIPTREMFSFTAAGRPWIDYYWMFDLGGAWLARLGGLPLYATACMLAFGVIPLLIYRRARAMGAGILPALVATELAYLILRSHAVARPHVLTYLFFALLLARLELVEGSSRDLRRLWWLPLLAMVWCNVHGGFAVGLVLVAVFAGATAIDGVLHRDPTAWRRVATFGALLAAMTVATLANPSGIRLHLDILHYLSQPSIKYFEEFQSPNFLVPSLSVAVFEITALVVLAVAMLGGRFTLVEAALVVLFLRAGLHSVRHMNLFAIVAAPLIAREITPPLARALPRLHARWERIAAEQCALRSSWVYIPAVSATFLGLAMTGHLGFPDTLDGLQLTRGAAEFVQAHRERFERPFNTDNLGGAMIYRFWPHIRVFVDDRIAAYGEDFIANDYFTVFLARPTWRDVLGKHDVTAALVSTGAPCAPLFREAPDWRLEYEDEKNLILFPRVAECR